MPDAPKILAFAASTRKDSFNKKLVKVAVAGARGAGAEVTELDLADLPMPIYDGDLEAKEGLPENAKKFKKLMFDHRGLLISAPEYNSSITGVLKNAIDWASRQANDEEKPLACFVGKVAALMAASPGGLGGLRGLFHVREILGNIKVLVLPNLVTLPAAHEAFDSSGKLKDAKKQAQMEKHGAELAEVLKKLT
jgi:chromate reductase, NAD(P)H dehydrogenase (quinone)